MPTQSLGGSLFNDPTQNPYAIGTVATLGQQSLGGGMFNDPRMNPAYMNSDAAIAQQYAINHRGVNQGVQGSIGAGPGNQYQAPAVKLVPGGYVTPGPGNQFHAGAPPAPAAPTVQPPNINWGLINQLLQGGSGVGGNQMPTYSSNITAGPVWNPQQTSAATSAIAAGGGGNLPLIPGMSASGAQQGSVNQQAADAGHAQTAAQAVNFGRDAAQANAQMQLQTQQARAQQGVSLANFLATIQGQNFSQQQQQRSLIEALLGQLAPAMGL